MILRGYKAILRFLSEKYAYKVTERTLRRMARRKKARFPLADRVRDHRLGVVASASDVKLWAKRNILPPEPTVSAPDKIGGDPLDLS